MKFASFLLSAFCLAVVSCERHNIEETKHLYEDHSAHADHKDDHGKKEHKADGHGEAAH